MSRKKLTIEPVRTREEMEAVVGEICALSIRQDELVAQRDAYLMEVRERYKASLAEIEPRIARLLERAESWAEAHPEEFGKAKSIEMTHGVVGYRTGQPKLKTLAKWTWDRVLQALKDGPRNPYVRVREEVDKERLLADRDALGPRLSEFGLRVMQDEVFYVQPHRENANGGA